MWTVSSWAALMERQTDVKMADELDLHLVAQKVLRNLC